MEEGVTLAPISIGIGGSLKLTGLLCSSDEEGAQQKLEKRGRACCEAVQEI